MLFFYVKSVFVFYISVYEIFIFLWAIVLFYSMTFFSFFYFSAELVNSSVGFGLLIGIIYGIGNKLSLGIRENEQSNFAVKS